MSRLPLRGIGNASWMAQAHARPSTLDRAAGVAWRFLVIVLAVAVVVVALGRLRLVVIPVIVALFLATVFVPPVRWLERRGWRPLLATFAVLLGSALVLAGVVSAIVPVVASELDDLTASIEEGIVMIERWATEGPLGLTDAQLERYVDEATKQLQSSSGTIATGVLGGVRTAAEIMAGVLLVPVIMFFLVKDGEGIGRWLHGHVPERHRPVAREAGLRAWDALGAYVRGTAAIGLTDAVVIGVGLFVVGVPLVVPLMLLIFFGAFFPLVGAALAGLVAALVALVNGGPIDALIVVAIVIVVQQVEGDVLAPALLGRAVRLHPLAILLLLAAGAVLAGVIGAFLAVPIAAVGVAISSAIRERSGPAVDGAR